METKQEKTIKNRLEDTAVYSGYIEVLNNEIIEKIEDLEMHLFHQKIQDKEINKSIDVIHSLSFMIEEFQKQLISNINDIIQNS